MKTKLLSLILILFFHIALGQTWKTYNSKNSGLINDIVTGVVIDNQANVWFTTVGGLSKFDGSSWENYLKDTATISPVIDKTGKIWFGIDNNIMKFDGANFSKYNSDLLSNGYNGIAIDSSNNIWVSQGYISGGGVFKFNGNSWSSFLKDTLISSIYIDKNSDIWFGYSNEFETGDNIGVIKYNGTSWLTIRYEELIFGNSCIVIDKDGILWYGMYNGGLAKIDGSNIMIYTKENGLGDDWVSCIIVDDQNNKWVGTTSGVSKFDGNTWTTYKLNNGDGSNYINSLAIDKFDNIWAGTRNGVFKLESSISGVKSDERSSKIFIYPNPIYNNSNIIMPQSDKYQVSIFNSIGVLVKEYHFYGIQTILNTESINSGIYLLQVKSLTKGSSYKNQIVVLSK